MKRANEANKWRQPRVSFWLLSALGLLATTASGATIQRVLAGNVSASGFSLLVETDATADLSLALFAEAEGGAPLQGDERVEWNPLGGGALAIDSSTYNDRQAARALQDKVAERNLAIVAVSNLSPGTTYHAELAVFDAQDDRWIPVSRVPVTTASRVAFIAESRQVLIDVSAAETDLDGTVVVLEQAQAAYPLFTVVGDVGGGGRALLDLTALLTADGHANLTFDSATSIELALWGIEAEAISGSIPYEGAFRVAEATSLVYAIGPALDRFEFENIGPQRTGVPFTLTVRALDADGTVLNTFEQAVGLTATPGPLTGGGTTPPFEDGVLTGVNVTVGAMGYHVLQVEAADGTISHSNTFPVTKTAPMSFAAWQSLVFGADAGNPQISGPDRDPNGNGWVNLLEYAFGMDPLSANPPPHLPQLLATEDGWFLEYYQRTDNAALEVFIERSTGEPIRWNLHTPNPSDIAFSAAAVGLERVRVRLPAQAQGLNLYQVKARLAD